MLREVPGSVSWLLKGQGNGSARLADEARRLHIDLNRLVYLDRLPNAQYLARYRHVDLFPDTENYNAHTTAFEALWAGCPVLTRPGDTFASRLAGSFNHISVRRDGMPAATMRSSPRPSGLASTRTIGIRCATS